MQQDVTKYKQRYRAGDSNNNRGGKIKKEEWIYGEIETLLLRAVHYGKKDVQGNYIRIQREKILNQVKNKNYS